MCWIAVCICSMDCGFHQLMRKTPRLGCRSGPGDHLGMAAGLAEQAGWGRRLPVRGSVSQLVACLAHAAAHTHALAPALNPNPDPYHNPPPPPQLPSPQPLSQPLSPLPPLPPLSPPPSPISLSSTRLASEPRTSPHHRKGRSVRPAKFVTAVRLPLYRGGVRCSRMYKQCIKHGTLNVRKGA